jgi:MFS family permease
MRGRAPCGKRSGRASLLLYGADQDRGKAIPIRTPATAIAMNAAERRCVGALTAVYLIRMLGLFLLLPVLAIHAAGLPGATPVLIGLAMGIYGLTQAVLQIPFGRWSDRRGRKPVIAFGLALLVAGSICGALAHDLWTLIGARALQGGGAISAVATALLADQTRDAVRTRAMALIGIGIGIAFITSLVLAPLLDSLIGVSGIFWLMAILGLIGLGLLGWVVPREPPSTSRADGSDRRAFLSAALAPQLLPLHAGAFALQFALTAVFLAVPLALVGEFGLARDQHWEIYLGVFAGSLLLAVPMILGADRSDRAAPLLVGAAALLVTSQLLLVVEGRHLFVVLIALTLFFAGVNFLEARLPALLSRAAPVAQRGAALGVYGTAQFLGAFCGGVTGGLLLRTFGSAGVHAGGAVDALAFALFVSRVEFRAGARPAADLALPR